MQESHVGSHQVSLEANVEVEVDSEEERQLDEEVPPIEVMEDDAVLAMVNFYLAVVG